MSRKEDFVVPKMIKVHGVEMVLDDLDVDATVTGGWEVRAEYTSTMQIVDGSRTFTMRFNSEEQFNKLLALASGEVVKQ